jgi:hypothetical protein
MRKISGALCNKSVSGLKPPEDLGSGNLPGSVAHLAKRHNKTGLPMIFHASS